MNETLALVLSIAVWFGGSRVIAALVALIVDIGKRIGWVKDDHAGEASALVNLVGLGLFVAFFMFNPAIAFAGVEGTLQLAMDIVLIALAYVDQLGFSARVHNEAVWMTQSPFFYSFGKQKAEAEQG